MNGGRTPIDWDEVKRRVAAVGAALERSLGDDGHRVQAAYRERAVRLAAHGAEAGAGAEGPDGSAAATTAAVLVFAAGAERYALPLGDVAAVLPFSNCTPVPGAPAELLGVTNVRGEIRSVVDLKRLLGVADGPEDGPPGYVVLVRHKEQVVGLRVDRLEKADRVAPAVAGGPAESGGRFHTGMTADGVILLDTGALLDHPVFHPANP